MTFALIALAILFLLSASTRMMPLLDWYVAISALFVLAVITPLSKRYVLPGIFFILFCTYFLLHALLISQVFDEKAVFLAVTLCLPFFIFSSSSSIEGIFRLAVGVISVVSYTVLILLFTGLWHGRVSAVFGTPNTFASYVNLFLAPLLAYYLCGKGGRGVFALLLLLFATLVATQSRGGYLGLFVSMIFFATFIGFRMLRFNLLRARDVLLGFSVTALAVDWLPHFGAVWTISDLMGDVRLMSSGSSYERLEIYRIACQSIKDNVLMGNGTFTFGYYFEMLKGERWFNRRNSFVHNDYLQITLENGILGIGLFLALILLIYFCLYRNRTRIVSEDRIPLIMTATGITSMLAHSTVDFPFYVPLFQAILGAYIGVINRQLVDLGEQSYELPSFSHWKIPGLSTEFVRSMLVVSIFVWLSLPVLANRAAAHGLIRLKQGDPQDGVYWHSIASMLQPGKFEYYWRIGTIWEALGAARHDPDLMSMADDSYANASAANPLEVTSFLTRAQMYRVHRDLLPARFSEKKMMEWILHAKKMRPYSEIVQMEYVRTLMFLGRQDEAIKQAEVFVKWYPGYKAPKILLEEVRKASPIR